MLKNTFKALFSLAFLLQWMWHISGSYAVTSNYHIQHATDTIPIHETVVSPPPLQGADTPQPLPEQHDIGLDDTTVAIEYLPITTTPLPPQATAPIGVSVYIVDLLQDTVPQIKPFDGLSSFCVPWDSIMMKSDTLIISRIFAAREIYGTHLLPSSDKLTPEITQLPERVSGLLTFIFTLSLLQIGLANYFFPQRLREMLRAAWDTRLYSQLERGGGILKHYVSYFLNFNFLLVTVALIYQSVNYFELGDHINHISSFVFYGILLLTLILYYFFKYISITFLAWVFERKESGRTYFHNIVVVNNFAGLVLLPAMVINTYNPMPEVLYASLAIFLLINIYKIVRGGIFGHIKTGFPVCYFILYICTVEIAPLLLLLKISINYL